jgi:uncharacterized protein (DUF4415 family)
MKKAKLNSRQMREIRALAAMPDDQIDTSEIPELTAEDFKRGTRGLLYRPMKRSVTIRLDADVIAWLKQEGPGYQTKANWLLRMEMLKSRLGKKRVVSVGQQKSKRTGTRSK